MEVTLIHNPNSGQGSTSNAEEIMSMIRAAGHKVRYQSSKEKNWKAALKKAADLVAIAGGDGTVGKVARRMPHRDLPVTILPQGTANNIAHALEIAEVPLPQLIAGWATARAISFNLGIAAGPWGERTFLESAGVGLFAAGMSQLDESSDQDSGDPQYELRAARRFLRARLKHFAPVPLLVHLDGKDLSGDYLLLETMNIPSIGPNLVLAPDADPSDGLLDVVLVPGDERDNLLEYLRVQRPENSAPRPLPIHRGSHLRVQTGGAEVHLDDRSFEGGNRKGQRAARPVPYEVRIDQQALSLLVPVRA
jgi:diacylglycerol kinase family enzyme